MKYYAAGSSKEIVRVERIIAMLNAAGHECTFDWPAHVRSVQGNALPTGALRRSSALSDIRGIVECDVFIFLHPAPGIISAGACFELGFELGLLYMLLYESMFEGEGPAFDFYSDADLMRLLNPKHIPTVISYENEVFPGPLLFDAVVGRPPVLDKDLTFTLQHIAMHEMAEE